MFTISIANILVRINNKYEYLEKFCANYIVNSTNYDLDITVTDEDISLEKEKTIEKYSDPYIESICCYRKICLELPKFNAFLLHASVVGVKDFAYAFSAKSGTGKTTHTKLWKELLGSDMFYINGDKPIIRIIDEVPIAYGTPWCGKERQETNTSRPLKALCFIERSLENEISILDKKSVLQRILHQILIPEDEICASLTFSLLNKTIEKINTYVLKCNMDVSAAVLAYNTMK